MTDRDNQCWRLIALSEHDAATNMAIDEAILETHALDKAPPTVRLYRFTPASVTIGFGQKMPPADIARIRRENFEIVRRPTGGRAVLHDNDLTYAFIGSAIGATKNWPTGQQHQCQGYRWEPFLSPTINGAYRQICQGLIEALRLLGVEAELGSSDANYRQLHDCFLATTTADLHVNGKKMIGSAQLRRNSSVLQHGSILLDQDQHLMQRLLTGDQKQTGQPLRHANLFQAAGRKLSWVELEHAIKAGFEKAFSCRLERGELSEREWQLTKELRPKYELPTNDAPTAARSLQV